VPLFIDPLDAPPKKGPNFGMSTIVAGNEQTLMKYHASAGKQEDSNIHFAELAFCPGPLICGASLFEPGHAEAACVAAAGATNGIRPPMLAGSGCTVA